MTSFMPSMALNTTDLLSPDTFTYTLDYTFNVSVQDVLNNTIQLCTNKTVGYNMPFNLRVLRIVVEIFIVGFLCLFGFIGNALSIMVLRRDRDKKNTTNWLLQALAMSDTYYLITCLFLQTLMAIDKYTDWWPGLSPAIPYIYTFIWPLASIGQTATVWLVMLVTMDRYLAICMPLRTSMRTIKRAKVAVIIVVIVAMFYNIPRFFERRVIFKYDPCSNKTVATTVRVLFTNKPYVLVYKNIFYFTFRAIGPLFIIIFWNLRLISALRMVRRKHRDLTRGTKHRENITLMLIAVVTVFIFCVIPDMILRITLLCRTYLADKDKSKIDLNTMRYVNVITNMLLTINSSINFLIYCLIGNKFRKIMLQMCWPHRKSLTLEVSESEPLTVRTNVTQTKNGMIRRDDDGDGDVAL